ncbi:DNA polymerase [Listeria phage A511]|uniref:Gp138 n=2 Tax=Pecentumvirus TaxID=1857844 RepID=A8ASX2_BPA51|nr:DNA polymerase [Listeria phage A511]AAY52919.1 gp138 [Listeria phage A511]
MQYDIRFLMSSKGFTKFNNNRDTKIGYYLSVTQQIEDSFKLSDLAYEMTDMGGYDKPLADFKKKYIKDYNDKKTAEQEERKKKIVEEINKQFVEETLKFKEDTKKYNEEKANNTYSVLVKPVKPKKGKAPTKAELAYEPLANEVDGGNFNYDWIPLEILHPYASGDTDCCLRIHNVLTEIIAKNQKMWFQFANFYPSAIVALARIESNGIYAQTDYMEDINEKYTEEEERLVEEMRKIAEVSELEEQHMELYERGVEEMAVPPAKRDDDIAKLRNKYKNKLKFNPNSATDKGKVLYQIMGITLPYDKEHIKESAFDVGKPENKLTWEDYKTDKKALNYIVDHFPDQKVFASLLLEHSLVKTRKNNFTAKLLNFISNKDGRVHGSFNATGTETTRLSSNNPNMQQLPAKTSNPKRFDYQYPIKRMFQTAFENGALLQLDYSSLEMRILALAAGDEAMTQAFFDGADLHKETASIVWGMPVDKVPAEFRKKAKAVNFGIAYGETPFSFAPKHDMSVEEAEDIFQRYFANKPNIKTFIDETHREALRDGFVDTLQGHRRLIRDAFSKDKQIQNGALRKSVNTKIQGTGAYCTNMSLIYIDQYIQDNNMKSKLVLTVHDSIVVDCPPEEIEIMARVCKTIMENLPIDFLSIEWKGEKTKYPIEADIEIGTNYNDMVEYNPSELKEFNSLTGYVKYYKDLGKISDYMEAGIITEESMDLGQTRIKESKEIYKKIA